MRHVLLMVSSEARSDETAWLGWTCPRKVTYLPSAWLGLIGSPRTW